MTDRNARRRAARALADRACERCRETFSPARRDARFCSTRCRVAAHRAREAEWAARWRSAGA